VEAEMVNASAYRARAQEIRELAKSRHDRTTYQELLNIAVQYEELARQVEKLDLGNIDNSEPISD
jgi:hypothetical protein